MRAILEVLITIPVPLILMLCLGLVFWKRRKLSFSLIFIATFLLMALSMPIVAGSLALPLWATAETLTEPKVSKGVVVVVPTAGIYEDSSGRWWPTSSGIQRGATGQRLSQFLSLPLILSGGRPNGEPMAEAEVLANHLGLMGSELILETQAKNSFETAVQVGRLINTLGGSHVILATSPIHIARMAACLRGQGMSVSPVIVSIDGGNSKNWVVEKFLPNASSFGLSRNALHEYFAILFYLLEGHIRLFDLVP